MPWLMFLDHKVAKLVKILVVIAMIGVPVRAEEKIGPDVPGIELRAARDQVVNGLVTKLERTPEEAWEHFAKYDAIRVLASYRAPEAAKVLVAEATFVMRDVGISERHPLQIHTAAYALTKIGLPAYDAIFRRLILPATEEELRIFAYVLCAHDGRLDTQFGRFLIQRARRNDDVMEQVENLDMLDAIISAQAFGEDTDWPSTKYARRFPE